MPFPCYIKVGPSLHGRSNFPCARHVGTTQFPFLPDWTHGREGTDKWSKMPTENIPVYFAGGDLVGCLSHSIFSSHRVHRSGRPPLGVPVVKLFCQYVYPGLTFRPTLDTPRFCSRPQHAPVLRRLPVHGSMQSIPPSWRRIHSQFLSFEKCGLLPWVGVRGTFRGILEVVKLFILGATHF